MTAARNNRENNILAHPENRAGNQTAGATSLLLILGALVALGPVSTDAYVPGLPRLAADLRARQFYAATGFVLTSQSDGSGNEEREPDCTYAWSALPRSQSQ